MNKLQYRIVKSVLAVGADPITFAKMCNAEPIEFIKVQTTDNYEQYADEDRPTAEQMVNDMFKGRR